MNEDFRERGLGHQCLAPRISSGVQGALKAGDKLSNKQRSLTKQIEFLAGDERRSKQQPGRAQGRDSAREGFAHVSTARIELASIDGSPGSDLLGWKEKPKVRSAVKSYAVLQCS